MSGCLKPISSHYLPFQGKSVDIVIDESTKQYLIPGDYGLGIRYDSLQEAERIVSHCVLADRLIEEMLWDVEIGDRRKFE